MTKRETRRLARQILKQQRALEIGKAGYKRAEQLLEEIIVHLKPGEAIDLGDGSTAQLVDKFACKNRIGAGLGVNRYEIETKRAAEFTGKL